MNESLQELEIKVENQGKTPQGRISAEEWNILVEAVKALDLTPPGGGGGSIEYPLTWSGYSSGSYDGSASKNIAIPSLLSQLTNDAGFATSASVNSLLTSYVQKSAIKSELGISDWALASSKPTYTASEVGALSLNGGTVNGSITATSFIGDLVGNADTASLWPSSSVYTNDFNAVSNNGLYHFDGDYANLNGRPAHYSWNYTLLNMGSGDIRRQQLAIPYDTTKAFLRRNSDGVWSDWREFAFIDSDNFSPTSGKMTVNGDIQAPLFKIANNTSGTAISFPTGECIDIYGNVRFSSTSGSWSVFKDGRSLLRILASDATLDLNPVGSIYRFRLIANNSYSYLQAGSSSGNERGAMCLSGYYANLLTSLRLNTEEVVITGTLAGEEVGRMRIITDSTYSYIQAASTSAGHQGAICLSGYFATQLTSLKLHAKETTVTGNIVATGGIAAQNTSDRRLKQNIRAFDAISILRGMGGVHAYEYVDTEVARDARYAGTHYGFIYQDVEGSNLERMCLKREDGHGALNYLDSNLISVVAGGVLSLDDRVKLLEQENEQLRQEINRLNASLS